jgi:hypothetical protein
MGLILLVNRVYKMENMPAGFQELHWTSRQSRAMKEQVTILGNDDDENDMETNPE